MRITFSVVRDTQHHNSFLQDKRVYDFLLLIDQDLAARARRAGCACCGGALCCGSYDRKPRGGPEDLDDEHKVRLSFCCSTCRRRTTPVSVRFLGRRVYFAPVVVLVPVMRRGIKGKAVEDLCEALSVPRRTLERWRQWWCQLFVATPFWKEARARFMPPPDTDSLPSSLLERFQGETLRDCLILFLRFLVPLTSTTAHAS